MYGYSPDFEPKGILKADPITTAGYCIIAGIWSIGGISIYFLLLNSVMLLMIFLGSGAIFAAMSLLRSKTVYYWDDEHFAAVRPTAKAVVYCFDEIKCAAVTYSLLTIDTAGGKRYIIPRTYSGTKEFEIKLREAEKLEPRLT